MNSQPVLWAHMTVQEMRGYLRRRQSVLLPVGCTEQHGYHLPLNTDILNAEEISKRVSQRTGIVVAPTVNYTYSGGELPGTVNVSPNVLALYLEEILLSFCAQGFRRIYIVLGHGGSENLQALNQLRDMFLRKHRHLADSVLVAMLPVWEFGNGRDLGLITKRDFHAARNEGSLMLFWAPELVRMDRVALDARKVAQRLRHDPDSYQETLRATDSVLVSPLIRQRRDIKVGVLGYPEKAERAYGKKLCQSVVQDLSRFIEELEATPTRKSSRARR
jgi:creatinine amidohydrolase